MTDKTPEALAVLDEYIKTIQPLSPEHVAWLAKVTESRAAFADLIEAADEALTFMQRTDPQHGMTTALREALNNVEKLP